MPRIELRGRAVAAVASLVLSLACLGLEACGSSSSASTPTTIHTTAAATPTTSARTAPGNTTPTNTTPPIKTERQFVAVYKCMLRNGIKLPPLKELTKVNHKLVNSSRYQATLARCRHAVLG
jgi:hypothetical protein